LLPQVAAGTREAREAANRELHGFVESLRDALRIDASRSKDTDAFDDPSRKNTGSFRLSDRKLALPPGIDTESVRHRAQAIHTDLEIRIGADNLTLLKRELEVNENGGGPGPSIIDRLHPGLVCLAQQLLVLDGELGL
jgi:hypothetical protein